MVSVCLPSDALSKHLLSYWGFTSLGRGVCLHGCSSKVQPLLLTLDVGYLLSAAPAGKRVKAVFSPSSMFSWQNSISLCPALFFHAGVVSSSHAVQEWPLVAAQHRSSQEELPHVQGKEQRLCFAGAAMKRYPTSKVRETQVRW